MNRSDTYLHLRDQVIGYMRALEPSVRMSHCHACPAWTLQDVVAHHIHAQLCLIEHDFPRAALAAITAADEKARADATATRDAWAENGVVERRGKTLEDLSEEWDMVIAKIGDSEPLILDLSVHFDDIRETVEGAIGRSDGDLMIALRDFHRIQAARLDARGLQQVSLFSTNDGQLLSRSEHALMVRGTTYELLRCLTSRRDRASADQVLDWGELASTAREAFAVYGWPA